MAKGGGGAWKVAYADFVTAMMAFFLVMWICGQDQKIRRAVSYYFNDPFSTSMVGNSKKPTRTGSMSELSNTGSVPKAESVTLGQGRKSHTDSNELSPSTKLVSDWLHADDESAGYWREQAQRTRDRVLGSKELLEGFDSVERASVVQLAKQLKSEVTLSVAARAKGLSQDLLMEVIRQINWAQLAEDLLAQ